MKSILIASTYLLASVLWAGSSPPTPSTVADEPSSDLGLTGDWGGTRARMAESGLSIDLNGIYSYQGVARGGLNIGNDSGSVFSANLNLALE